ncbi:hypothetical protein Zmor_021682 [Zophobas morio]|uniref:CHK kinase-like domain-containing protein n=1 Tax=Zophobas morio TaxID=2755281 RepID=A0AA38I6Q8_9CUCU|nr:hypothetical protein Zmor_021682 [Zophobas morio]
MSVTLSEEKNDLVKAIAKSQGFDDYTVNITSGSMKGDGYLGIIYTVYIQDKRKICKHLHLIMKSALTEETLRENSPIKKAYDREIYLYNVVFPAFDLLSHEVGITNRFCETAKFYGSLSVDKEECIVLENLKEMNFKLWNRKLAMDEKHVALVFKTYAKFHGTGLALKYLKPEKYEELCKNLKNIFRKDEKSEDDMKQFQENMKFVFTNGFRAVANDEKATQGLTKFAQECKGFFMEDLQKAEYSTILHGDCWCNNMMFKYNNLEDSSRPSEMCLLDWQISQTGSPVLDLSYFFYACSAKNVLYKLKDFLTIYHQNLSKTLEEAGVNPNDIPTYEGLEDQWKFYSKHGLFMTLLVMKVILSEVEEAPDLSELAKSGKNLIESISGTESKNMEAINKRLADVIVFMNEQDYL